MATNLFSWHETPKAAIDNRTRREEMYRRELEDRAQLLFRLGFGAKQCKTRLRQSVAWEFELHDKPKHAGEVDKIVDAVYKRGGSYGPPSV